MYVNDVHNRLSLFPIVLSLSRHRERGCESRNAQKRTCTAGGRKTLLSWKAKSSLYAEILIEGNMMKLHRNICF